MGKRRRTSSFAGDKQDELEQTTPTHPTRKRKKVQYDPVDICQDLYDFIRNHKNEDGRIICEAFIRVPKRRAAADYYDVVTQPIDLLKIQNKLKNDEYDEVDDIVADVELMVNNAKAYYKKTTSEYKDACDVWELFVEKKSELILEALGESPTEVKSDTANTSNIDIGDQEEEDDVEQPPGSARGTCSEEDAEELFTAVFTAKENDRPLGDEFQLLPSRMKYQEYYAIIKEPIDLKIIAMKIQEHKYNNLDDLEKDLLLMVRNAKTFNEPGSQIYKDACTLKKIIITKKLEIDNKVTATVKTSERIRSRRSLGTQKLSAICASLQYQYEDIPQPNAIIPTPVLPMEVEEGDESGCEGSTTGEEGTLWTLYNYVKNYKNAVGQVLSEPFTKLPSRRNYPDYYKEIKNPVSMMNIKKHLKLNHYENLEDLGADFETMFTNAKKYNTDESRLFKVACKLQKVMRAKYKELEDKFEIKNEMDEDEMAMTPRPAARAKTPRHGGSGSKDDLSERKKSKSKAQSEEALRKRLWLLYKTVHDFEEGGRPVIGIFTELPSKKDYPDYYHVISEPIDMSMIERKILEDRYNSEQGLVADFELMFNNARHYNEEESLVYKDAETLEKVLKKKLRSLSPLHADIVRGLSRKVCMPGLSSMLSSADSNRPKTKSLSSSPLEQKLQHMYNTIKDHTDSRGRILSTPFIRLPTKTEYPNYYEVIKKPIDMQRIHQRMMSKQYESIDDMVADIVLMFDNACKYNEPDSLIYKDALTLQRLCLEKKSELTQDDDTNEVPDVKGFVQELMTNLFISCYNHQDEEGRCYSDSFAELPVQESTNETDKQTKKLSFDQIKKNLNKGRYRRIDRFQEDMFEVFDNARAASRTDSQVYEDAIELQMFFMKIRDELCKNGEILLTPALSYTEKHLQNKLEEEKKEKLPKELKEDEEKMKLEAEEKQKVVEKSDNTSSESATCKGITYNIGDFVYLEPRDRNLEPHILCIEKMWKDTNGEWMIYGCWYYRPNETYHVATRKFLEKEVFKGDFYDSSLLSKVHGKCYVMFVKDYFKMRPEGFDDKDVHVCESRYSARQKAFKKIKLWPAARTENVTLLPREIPLSAVRVASVFMDRVNKEETDIDDTVTTLLDKKREVVPVEGCNPAEDGCTYYEQYITPMGSFKLGDCVYVRSSTANPYIARIDKLWTDRGDNAFFHGPYFVTPGDVEHPPTRLFYKREVFLSSTESTTPLIAIVGKCCVLSHKEYCTSRTTEYMENDIYICESKYSEPEKSIRKISKGLKHYQLSPRVCDDEIYFFKKPITPKKEPSPLLMKVADEPYQDTDSQQYQRMEGVSFNTDSFDGYSTVSDTYPSTPIQTQDVPKSSKKGPPSMVKPKKKHVPSGYIVYAGECRKTIQEEHPDMTFGEISKIVGTKWRNLPRHEKERFEEKAKRIAEDQAAKQQEAEKAFNESLQMYPPHSPASGGEYGRAMSPASSGRPGTPGAHGQQNMQGSHPMPPPRPPSPMFVAVPPKTQRLLHSEAYLRYIEGLSKENKTITDWDKNLNACQENTPCPNPGKLPVSWLGNGAGIHGNTTEALWALRDLLLKDTLTITRTLDFNSL